MRLSLLGVYNINNLTECSKVLPPRVSSYTAPDQSVVDKWLQTKGKQQQIVDALMQGKSIASLLGLIGKLLKAILNFA